MFIKQVNSGKRTMTLAMNLNGKKRYSFLIVFSAPSKLLFLNKKPSSSIGPWPHDCRAGCHIIWNQMLTSLHLKNSHHLKRTKSSCKRSSCALPQHRLEFLFLLIINLTSGMMLASTESPPNFTVEEAVARK